MTQQTETMALTVPAAGFTVKVGTKERTVAAETLMVLGGKVAQQLMHDLGFAGAVAKARNGNYRAAVEIMALAAHPSQIKATQPPTGVWTKARVGMLAELVLERKPPEGKGWSPKALKGRKMAQLVAEMTSDAPPKAPAGTTKPATEEDPLNTVATF